MLKIQEEIDAIEDAQTDQIYYDASNLEVGETYVITPKHSITIVENEQTMENVDLEASDADRVTTLIFHINGSEKDYYRQKTSYSSWGDGERDDWEVVKRVEKTITVWEKV